MVHPKPWSAASAEAMSPSKAPERLTLAEIGKLTVDPTASSLFQILFRAGVILGEQTWVSFAERRRSY